MAAYLLVDLDVKNSAALENYRAKVPATVAKYGGRFVVRGGAFEVLEGDWQPTRIIVLEFPSMGSAQALVRFGRLPPADRRAQGGGIRTGGGGRGALGRPARHDAMPPQP